MRGRLLLGTLGIAGLAGAALTLGGVRSAATGPLTLLFLLLVPGICLAMLLTGIDAGARAIMAGAGAVVLSSSIAEVMLVFSIWSPKGGVIAVAIACALLTAAAVVRGRTEEPEEAETPSTAGSAALDS